jgi:hypothetical protein
VDKDLWIMMDILLAFLIGMGVGVLTRPKNVSLEEQKAIYEKKITQYEMDIAYYKELCKWHVERNKK